IVWALDCRIKAQVAVTSVTDASRNVTGEIERFIGGLVAEPSIFYDVASWGRFKTGQVKHLTRPRNRPRRTASQIPSASKSVSVVISHACHFAEQTVPRWPLQDRTRPLRHQADQEGHQDRPLFRSAA